MGFAPGDADLGLRLLRRLEDAHRVGESAAQEPQVILLDEPTNHMDLESVEWLERYLIEQCDAYALAIVSHDREFLDRVCTKIVETDQGKAYSYNGNYRNFLKLKGEREEQAMKEHNLQQKEIKALKGEINALRNDESAAASRRQKERQLKEMEPGGSEHVPRPFVNKRKFSFRFPPAPRCSQEVHRALETSNPRATAATLHRHSPSPPLPISTPQVIELEDVAHGYGGSTSSRTSTSASSAATASPSSAPTARASRRCCG